MKWISVKDRLPEDKQVVLVYSMNTYSVTFEKLVKPAIFEIRHFHKEGEGEFGRYWDSFRGDRITAFNWTHITHWMPLPEPPKE